MQNHFLPSTMTCNELASIETKWRLSIEENMPVQAPHDGISLDNERFEGISIYRQ